MQQQFRTISPLAVFIKKVMSLMLQRSLAAKDDAERTFARKQMRIGLFWSPKSAEIAAELSLTVTYTIHSRFSDLLLYLTGISPKMKFNYMITRRTTGHLIGDGQRCPGTLQHLKSKHRWHMLVQSQALAPFTLPNRTQISYHHMPRSRNNFFFRVNSKNL